MWWLCPFLSILSYEGLSGPDQVRWVFLIVSLRLKNWSVLAGFQGHNNSPTFEATSKFTRSTAASSTRLKLQLRLHYTIENRRTSVHKADPGTVPAVRLKERKEEGETFSFKRKTFASAFQFFGTFPSSFLCRWIGSIFWVLRKSIPGTYTHTHTHTLISTIKGGISLNVCAAGFGLIGRFKNLLNHF